VWGWYILPLSLGIMVSAAYALRTVGRLFTGPVRSSMLEVADLRRNELFASLVLAAGIIVLGVLPSTVLNLMSASVSRFSMLFAGGA
jgi:NADH-quinone oxidoreductase subunit M